MMKSKRLVIIGCGETAELAYEYFEDDSEYEVVAFAVNEQYVKNDMHLDRPLVGLESLPEVFPPSDVEAFVAVAYGNLNFDRKRLCDSVVAMGYMLASYVSSRAFLGRYVELGDNVFIMENCSIQHHVAIGDGVTMWSGCCVEHRSRIGHYAWLAPGVVISGLCSLGDMSFVGSNATLMDHVSVAAHNVIGAGALVGKSITLEGGIYASANGLRMLDDAHYLRFAGRPAIVEK